MTDLPFNSSLNVNISNLIYSFKSGSLRFILKVVFYGSISFTVFMHQRQFNTFIFPVIIYFLPDVFMMNVVFKKTPKKWRCFCFWLPIMKLSQQTHTGLAHCSVPSLAGGAINISERLYQLSDMVTMRKARSLN